MVSTHPCVVLAVIAALPSVICAQDAEWCRATRPPDSQVFTLGSLDSLVGKFELILIRTIPSDPPYTIRGVLELWKHDSSRVWVNQIFQNTVPDSIRKARPQLARYLGGAFELIPADTSTWWRRMASRDRKYPGVEWYFGRLRFGDRDVLDGTGEDLTVNWVQGGRFGGTWREDLGIAVVVGPNGPVPNSEGYFCARRLGA